MKKVEKVCSIKTVIDRKENRERDTNQKSLPGPYLWSSWQCQTPYQKPS